MTRIQHTLSKVQQGVRELLSWTSMGKGKGLGICLETSLWERVILFTHREKKKGKKK